ncbi:MAG TPA: hypothetical protein VLD63_13655 [Anaerolineales bacterium]|nr:hypothetical protein [Anaerolineales bacterium]
MNGRRPPIRLFAVVALAALACGGGTGTTQPKDVADAVAATLTALAGPSPMAPAPVEAATVSPEPPGGGPAPAVLRVVYTNGSNAWILEGANPPLQLTTSGSVESVRISDDGLRIAFTRRPDPDAPAELRAVHNDGSGEVVLLSQAQIDAIAPLDGAHHNDLSQFDFLPGTHNVMLNTRGVFLGPGLAKHDNLLVVDADTAVLTQVLPPGSGGDFTPSPDGTRLAIVRPDSVDLANVDGSAHQVGLVTYEHIITYSEYLFYVKPVWRSDGSEVGVVIPSPDPLTPPLSGTVWRVPAAGGTASPYPAISGQFFLFAVGSEPLLSPDLLHVAYSRETATTNIWDLFVARPDGSGEALVATGDVRWAGWSPDGGHFLFTSGGPMNLQLGTVGGGSSPLVVGTDFRWINSTDYLYLSGSAGAWTLHRGTLGGANVPLVSPSGDAVQFDVDE